MMGLTISGLNNSAMAGGNSSNLAHYQGNNNDANSPNDFDNAGEDFIMMNIPREGNADQLNKSTKLTLSSKK